MSKMKTHKGAMKRLRITGKKKVKFNKNGKRHLNSSFSGRRIRDLRRAGVAEKTEVRRLERLLHMRLTPA